MTDRLNSLHSLDILNALADKVIEVEPWQEMRDYLDAVQKEVRSDVAVMKRSIETTI